MTTLHQSSGTSWRFDGITSEHNFKTVKVFSAKLVEKIKQHETIKATNYSIVDGDIILSESTKVFKAKQLQIPEDIMHQYKNPPILSVDKLKKSPLKTRVSIKGRIQKVKPQVQEKFWTRQNIEITDASSANQEEIKLWNTNELSPEIEGKMVTISNIHMTQYRNKNTKHWLDLHSCIEHCGLSLVRNTCFSLITCD